MIASRTKSKCDAIVKAIGNPAIQTAQVDADDVDQLVRLFESYRPDLVMNLALPYQDLTIMEACLRTGVSYLDTANYEPKDEAHFEYSWQWAYRERFEQAGLTDEHLHRLRRQAPLRRNPVSRHRRLQRR